MFFVLSRACDKEKLLSAHEESSLRPSDSVFRCSTISCKSPLTVANLIPLKFAGKQWSIVNWK